MKDGTRGRTGQAIDRGKGTRLGMRGSSLGFLETDSLGVTLEDVIWKVAGRGRGQFV